MFRTLNTSVVLALVSGLVVSSLALATPLPGAVTAIEKGMATVRTSDNKDHQVNAGTAWKVGDKVTCDTKESKMECQLVAASQPTVQKPTQPAPAQPAQPAAPQPAQPKSN